MLLKPLIAEFVGTLLLLATVGPAVTLAFLIRKEI